MDIVDKLNKEFLTQPFCKNEQLPEELNELTVTRRFRGSEYDIHIVNRAGSEKGKISLSVDGEKIDGCVIPTDADGNRHRVEVVID